MVFLELPITEKIFKQGDALRLEVKLTKVSGASIMVIGHDPANQPAGTNFDPANGGTTTMRVFVPFKLPL